MSIGEKFVVDPKEGEIIIGSTKASSTEQSLDDPKEEVNIASPNNVLSAEQLVDLNKEENVTSSSESGVEVPSIDVTKEVYSVNNIFANCSILFRFREVTTFLRSSLSLQVMPLLL